MSGRCAPRGLVTRAIAVCCALIGAAMVPGAPASATEAGTWWQPTMLVDYGLIAGGATTLGLLAGRAPPKGSGIGPSFDPAAPAGILDARLADRIGRKFLLENTGEAVPAKWVGYAIAPVAGWVLLQEALGPERSGDPRALRVHEAGVGLLETIALSLTLTEILKVSVGRLRPDFQDRVRRFYCNQPDHQGVACTGAETPLDPDPAKWQGLLDDGRKSFPSGHSSTSFALATYAALATGGRWVWSPEATTSSRLGGMGAQAAVLAAATYVAWSRVDDGRHNLSDVLTGAAIGTAMANIAYWRRFDTSGGARRAPGPAVNADFGSGGGALSLTLAW